MDVSLTLAKLHMNDYEKIRISPLYKKIEPSFTTVWHSQSKKWLFKEIQKCEATNIVVVTHHAPSIFQFLKKIVMTHYVLHMRQTWIN